MKESAPKLSSDQKVLNVITLLKIDVRNLFYRIEKRKKDYLGEFSLKRTREHFDDIFKSRYDDVSIDDLKELGQETIVGLDQFYQEVDELKWYLKHTQDMVQMMSDKVDSYIRSIKAKFDILDIYLEADLEIYHEKTHNHPPELPQELASLAEPQYNIPLEEFLPSRSDSTTHPSESTESSSEQNNEY